MTWRKNQQGTPTAFPWPVPTITFTWQKSIWRLKPTSCGFDFLSIVCIRKIQRPDLLTSQRSRCLLLRKSNHCTLTAPDRISLNSIRFNRIRIKSSLEHLLSPPPWQEEGGLLPLAGLPLLLWFTVIELSQDPLGDWCQDCHQNNPHGDTKSISN